MKKIAFTIEYNGEDGRARSKIMFASYSEEDRDAAFEADNNKAYGSKGERIIDVDKAHEEALSKLNGIDRLVLGMDQK